MSAKQNFRARFKVIEENGLFYTKLILKIGEENERDIIIRNHEFESESDCRAFIDRNEDRLIDGIFAALGYTVEERGTVSRINKAVH